MGGIFKAYDIRGIYGQDLTDELAYKIGRAFVTFTGRTPSRSSPISPRGLWNRAPM
jgi:phosphomannomutase